MMPSSWILLLMEEGPKVRSGKIEDMIHPLIQLCTKILSKDALFFLVNSYTTGLAPAVLTYMLATELKPWNGKSRISGNRSSGQKYWSCTALRCIRKMGKLQLEQIKAKICRKCRIKFFKALSADFYFTLILPRISPIGAEILKFALTVFAVSDLLITTRYFPRK